MSFIRPMLGVFDIKKWQLMRNPAVDMNSSWLFYPNFSWMSPQHLVKCSFFYPPCFCVISIVKQENLQKAVQHSFGWGLGQVGNFKPNSWSLWPLFKCAANAVEVNWNPTEDVKNIRLSWSLEAVLLEATVIYMQFPAVASRLHLLQCLPLC